MRLVRNRKLARRKREYLPARAKQRRRAASAIMAAQLVISSAITHSNIFTILSQPTLPSFKSGGIISGRTHFVEQEKILSKIEKANALVETLKNSAEAMAKIISHQTKLMK